MKVLGDDVLSWIISTNATSLGIVTPSLRSIILWSCRNWWEKKRANGELFCVKKAWHPFLLFRTILKECVTCKARWDLRKPCIANEIKKFLKNFFFKNSSSSSMEKWHSWFLRNQSSAYHKLPMRKCHVHILWELQFCWRRCDYTYWTLAK